MSNDVVEKPGSLLGRAYYPIGLTAFFSGPPKSQSYREHKACKVRNEGHHGKPAVDQVIGNEVEPKPPRQPNAGRHLRIGVGNRGRSRDRRADRFRELTLCTPLIGLALAAQRPTNAAFALPLLAGSLSSRSS